MTAEVKLPQTAKNIGFNGKLPDTATNIDKNTDGSFSITVKNPDGSLTTRKYDASGSLFVAPDTTPKPAASVDGNNKGNAPKTQGTGKGNDSGSAFGFGYSADTSGDINMNSFSAGYEINQNKFMKSAFGLNSIVNLFSDMPFGLAGLFSQGAMQNVMASFMNAVSFNFDFSKYFPKNTEGASSGDNQPATDAPADKSKTSASVKGDGKGARTETTDGEDGGKVLTEYDANGVIVKKTNQDKDGNVTLITEYENGQEVSTTVPASVAEKHKAQFEPAASAAPHKAAAKRKKSEPHKNADAVNHDASVKKQANTPATDAKKDDKWSGYSKSNTAGVYIKDGKYWKECNGKKYPCSKNGYFIFKMNADSAYMQPNGAATSTVSANYGNGNEIVKENTTSNKNIDTDAEFRINGGKYNIKVDKGTIMDETLDYYDITGQRSAGQHRAYSFVKHDGSLNADAQMFTNKGYYKKVYLSGEGALDNAPVERIVDISGKTVLAIKTKNGYVNFEQLMRTGKQIPVRPGTFISQG